MFRRNDYDPALATKFVKVDEKIDIKKIQKPAITKSTNWYEYVRIANEEPAPPEARGYLNIPTIQKIDLYASKYRLKRQEAHLLEQALGILIPIPQYDVNDREVIDQNGQNVLINAYLNAILDSDYVVDRENALHWLNININNGSLQDPKYYKALELVSNSLSKNAQGGPLLNQENLNVRR